MRNSLLAILIFFLPACGGDSSSSPSGESSLVGSWTTPCVATNIEGLSIYSKSTYTFTESDFDQTISYFSDSACTNTQTLSASAWIGSYGSYSKIELVITSSGLNATEIELIYLGKGFEIAGEITLKLAAYINNDALYLGTESGGLYTINLFNPYYSN